MSTGREQLPWSSALLSRRSDSENRAGVESCGVSTIRALYEPYQ